MSVRTLIFYSVVIALSGQVSGQDPDRVALNVSPVLAANNTTLRLLPADPDLKDGNAAVVMLRLIWEQTQFMQSVAPKLNELVQLPYDDPRIIDGFRFGHFQAQLQRAAYIRDAQWNYPLGEEPLATILLPDVQGFRQFVGRGMSLWVGQRIAAQDLDGAREGILVQLACARHVARTPLMVNRLVAVAMAEMALARAELLVQQPQSPNLYWALAMLPDALGDDHAAVQWESKMVTGSLPTLAKQVPPEGADAWKQVAAEFSEFMIMEMGKPLSPAEGAALKKRMLEVAKQDFSEQRRFAAEQLKKMSDEEIVMRWVLAETARVNAEIELAFSLPPPAALPRLLRLEKEIAAQLKRTGAPKAPYHEKPTIMYVAFHRFDRRVKLLQTAEAIRDDAARHDGKLPASLSELALPAPLDPLTAKPFEYSISDGKATLKMPILTGIEPATQRQTVYEISIAQAN